MWDGRAGLRRFLSSSLPYSVRCGGRALMLCAAALLMMVQGCCWDSSTPVVPTLPTLTSLQRLTKDGTPGVWMSSDDAGRLAVWIYDVTGEEGL